jgi:hypothetical protein
VIVHQLWTVFVITYKSNLWAIFSLTNNVLGYIVGDFFDKRTWSACFHHTRAWFLQHARVRINPLRNPGADPTIASYNDSAVKINNAASSLLNFDNKDKFFYFEKTL